MKNTKTTAPRMPRARVIYAYADPFIGAIYPSSGETGTSPHVLIRCATGNKKRDAKQARAFVRFWNLTEEKRVEQLARAMYLDDVGRRRGEPAWEECKGDYGNAITEAFSSRARAALSAITGGRT